MKQQHTTPCTVCGQAIAYTTNKPRYCAVHLATRPVTEQFRARRAAYMQRYRGDWLTNPTEEIAPSLVSDLAKQLGRRGGNATKAKHDPDYYKQLGQLGAQRRWAKQHDERGKPTK